MIYKTINQWTIWIFQNWIELVGVVFALIMLPLEIARKWTAWIVSICSSFFYIYINFTEKLYAMSGFCFYNIIISFYGIYCWKFIKTKNNQNLSFSFITKKLLSKLVPIGITIWSIILIPIAQFSYSTMSIVIFILDTLITTLSVIAAWLTVKKVVESWILWLIADICAIIVYIYKGMYPSVFLYIVYSIFSIFGYVFWQKEATKDIKIL